MHTSHMLRAVSALSLSVLLLSLFSDRAFAQQAVDLMEKTPTECDFYLYLSDVIPERCKGFGDTRGVTIGQDEAEPGIKPVAIDVLFEFDSYRLTDDAKVALDNLASFLKSEPSQSAFLIEGHTDATGSADYNMVLSVNRANAVKQYLVADGVELSRLVSSGAGESRLYVPDKPADGKNRRVEVANMGK